METFMKQTNIFKNFTDTVGFLGCFFSVVTVLLYKNEFKPTEEITKYTELENVKAYIFIAAIFFASAFIGCVLRKFPTFCLAISCLPVCFCYEGFVSRALEKKPVFYIILALIHAAGALVYSVQKFDDKTLHVEKEGKKSMAVSYLLAALSLGMWVANSFISVKYEKLLRLPFRFFVGVGVISGVMAIFWYFKLPKDKRNTEGALFWNSFSASLVCAMVFLARQSFALFGI